ncbi:pyruvate kinase [Azohydromonas aeria]|uniref:pyruvate kinase n=1 Tax=Azohydromonas aeria TaxID=2590212 RepID=UPI0012F7B497|nr:pyruvate kinase [Azohydromonas aeria]
MKESAEQPGEVGLAAAVASTGGQAGDPVAAGDGWDAGLCRSIIEELWSVRQSLLQHEQALVPRLAGVSAPYRESARNLAHYLALRRADRRPLQEKLATLGVSSLGRSESHVLANLDKALGILHRLGGLPWTDRSSEEPVGMRGSRELLERHALDLLGACPAGRDVRIMVTLPSEAAADDRLVRRLVDAGMDIARINCAHDGPAQWEAMAARVRQAAAQAGRPVRILMDLGGPKLRTGPIAPGPAVLKLKPVRDEYGHVVAPARLGLRAAGSTAAVPGAQAHLGVEEGWLARLKAGDRIRLNDARDARRELLVVACDDAGVLVECDRTIYVAEQTRLKLKRHGRHAHDTGVADVPCKPGRLLLRPGDRLRVTREGVGMPGGVPADDAGVGSLPSVPCTLPEVFEQVRPGERIWFDDGHIGAVIREAGAEGLEVEITQAPPAGARLAADKGINLPDSRLTLPALTAKDLEDLATVARCADMVGLSFVQGSADVDALRERLAQLGATHLGLVLKIETRRAFENLPTLMFAAMASPAAGIMIARGDLAVECGFERLAEVQEEMLWAAEAAHMPVIWATQVLESLAKTGMPSRAEITDAAMGERAECVMLNKGPFIADAMRVLDDILRRMRAHQDKKRSLLRALGAWTGPGPEQAGD